VAYSPDYEINKNNQIANKFKKGRDYKKSEEGK
jgi:hypothetical protein